MFKKNNSPVWDFFLPFRKVACDYGDIWYYCTLCHCAEPSTPQETMKGVVNYMKETPPAYRNMYFMGIQISSPVS